MTDYRLMGCDAPAGTIVGHLDGKLYPIGTIDHEDGSTESWDLTIRDRVGILGQDTRAGERLTTSLLNGGLLLTDATIRDLAAKTYSIPQRVVLGGVPPEDGIVALDPKAMLTTQPEEDQPMTTTTFDTHPSPDAPSTEVTEVWVRAENSTLTDRGFTYNPANLSDAGWYPLVVELLTEAGYRRVWPQED